MQKGLDAVASGLTVTEVRLQTVEPPARIKGAQEEAARSRAEKETTARSAQNESESRFARARTDAESSRRSAESAAEARILRARTDAQTFEARLREYAKARDVTKRRLRLETLERVLAKVKHKVFVDGAGLPAAAGAVSLENVPPRDPSQAPQ